MDILGHLKSYSNSIRKDEQRSLHNTTYITMLFIHLQTKPVPRLRSTLWYPEDYRGMKKPFTPSNSSEFAQNEIEGAGPERSRKVVFTRKFYQLRKQSLFSV